MASIYSSGPALVYVRANKVTPGGVLTPGGSGPVVFLGTFEKRPDIDITPAFTPVMNDLAGSALPIDRVFQGKEGTVKGTINRFNMNVLRGLMCQPPLISAVGAGVGDAAENAEGFDNLASSMGQLMNQPGAAGTIAPSVILYIVFSRMSTLASVGNVLPGTDFIGGYRFYSAFLMGPHTISPGTGDYKQNVVFQCQRQIAVGTSPSTTNMNLYDTNVNDARVVAMN